MISTSAFAQTAPVPPAGSDTVPKQGEAAPPAATDPNVPLSDKLKESEGVIKPPAAIDPEIRKPPPEPEAGRSNMPVIIPPGEPGGDQSVQPK